LVPPWFSFPKLFSQLSPKGFFNKLGKPFIPKLFLKDLNSFQPEGLGPYYCGVPINSAGRFLEEGYLERKGDQFIFQTNSNLRAFIKAWFGLPFH